MTNPFGNSQPFGTSPLWSQGDPLGAVDEVGDCNSMLTRLYTFLDGELTVDRRDRIQRHLDGCPSCFSAYDFEAELRGVVADRLQVQVPPQLLARIQLSIRECAIELKKPEQ